MDGETQGMKRNVKRLRRSPLRISTALLLREIRVLSRRIIYRGLFAISQEGNAACSMHSMPPLRLGLDR